MMGVALMATAGVLLAVVCAARAGHPPGTHPGHRRESDRDTPTVALGTWWTEQLRDVGLDGAPQRWACVSTLAVVVVTGGAFLRGGASGAAVAVVIVMVAAWTARLMCRGRGDRRSDSRLPDLLESAARRLRGGRDLPTSLRLAADDIGGGHGAELRAVTDRVEGGADLIAALDPWAERHPRPSVGLTVGALAVAAGAGGAAAGALDAVASTVRSRQSVSDEGRALASQARASAVVLIVLPVVVVVIGSVSDGRVAHSLLTTPLGLACLTAATVLDAMGGLWMHRIVAEAR